MDFAFATISSHDALRLRQFYAELTGSAITFDQAPYSVLGEHTLGARLAFQQIAQGQPVIPAHVDMRVADIDEAAARVLAAGGRLGAHFAEVGSLWRQAYDPDGNVFCLMAGDADTAANV